MKALFLIATMAVLGAGCRTTTKHSRQEAARLSLEVQTYREGQQKRIDTLNRDYQKTFARLMDELGRLYDFQVDQALDLGAMKITEDLLSRWEETTLPKQFRDTFAQTLDENLAKLEAADAALQQARATYAVSYKDAVLQLKKLDDVKSGLDTVSASPGRTKELTELLRTLYAVYQKSQTNTNSTPKGGTP
jgi:hypothetical protein